MEDLTSEQLRAIWNQKKVPVLLRRGRGQRLRLRLPYRPDSFSWLRGDRRSIPEWDSVQRFWEVPQAWFNPLVTECLKEFKRVYIIQPYREEEKCAPACWSAMGHICECSCMGANHGSQYAGRGWKVISDAFATRSGEQKLACRLLAVS
jgi:hypothetical protein